MMGKTRSERADGALRLRLGSDAPSRPAATGMLLVLLAVQYTAALAGVNGPSKSGETIAFGPALARVEDKLLITSSTGGYTGAQGAGPFPTVVSGVRNVTLYRLTPSNYTGLANLDSGDLAGDLGFGLWELLMPMLCREDPTAEVGCPRGTGQFIDAPGENLTYVKLSVEMNTLFTAYRPCNPDPSTGVFKCDPNMPGGPGGNGTQCHCSHEQGGEDCGCENMRSRAVGRDVHAQHAPCLHIRSEAECGHGDTQCACRWDSRLGQCRAIICEEHLSALACEAAVCAQGHGSEHQIVCVWVRGGGNDSSVTNGHCRRLQCSEVTEEKRCESAQNGYPGGGCSWDSARRRCTDQQQPDPCAATPSPCCDGITNATECGLAPGIGFSTNGNNQHGMDCQQCRWDFHSSQCKPFGCHNLTSKSLCTAAKCAGQCGHPKMGGSAPCNGTYVCGWDDVQESCHTLDCGRDVDTKERCDNSVDPQQLGDGCRWDPHSKLCSGDDDAHRMPAQDWRNELSVIDAARTEDIWYSTLEAGHCQPLSRSVEGGFEPAAAVAAADDMSATIPCTWRIASIDAVRARRCVTDHIIAPVLERNRSCFERCQVGTHVENRSSDCWITCLFTGMLGNQTTGAPPIGSDGSAASTGELLLARFKEAMDENNICPDLTSNQSADAHTARPVGVINKTLYRLTPRAASGSNLSSSSLANTNSADALGLLAVLRDDSVADLLSPEGQEGYRAQPAVGEALLEVNVSLNELWGELTLCAYTRNNNTTGGSASVRCAPQWNCTCQDHEGARQTCTGDGRHGNTLCECMKWGGCAGVDNSGVMSVGRRRVHGEAGLHEGHVYSTMAGGECDGWNSPCSWRQEPIGRMARTQCVRTALHDVSARISEATALELVTAAFESCLVY